MYSSFCLVFFERYGDHRDLHVLTHSFPTRRSSDLLVIGADHAACVGFAGLRREGDVVDIVAAIAGQFHAADGFRVGGTGLGELTRSEEHTSELQSLMRISYAVFCLKKKNKSWHINTTTNQSQDV